MAMRDSTMFRNPNRLSVNLLMAFAVFVSVLLARPQMFADGRWLAFAIGVALVAVITEFTRGIPPSRLTIAALVAQTLIVLGLVPLTDYYFLTPLLTFVTVGLAQIVLPLRWRNIFAIALAIAIALIFAIASGWVAGIQSGLGYAAGFVFVIAFMRIAQSEAEARQALAQAHQQLTEYAAQVERLATLRERNRLAREVHDSMGHYLTTLTVQLEIVTKLIDTDPGRARDAALQAKQLASEGLEQIRRSVAALRPSPLDDLSLEQTIQNLANDAASAGLVCHFTQTGTRRPLSPEIEIVLYRAAQEALTNIRKHAHAHKVEIHLNFEADAAHLSIRDDGVGRKNPQDGFGLSGLRERVSAAGGKMWAENHPEGGFIVEMIVPCGSAQNG